MSDRDEQIATIANALQTVLGTVQVLAAEALAREMELAQLLAIGLDTVAKEAAVDSNLLIHVLERQVELRREAGSAPHIMAPCEAVLSSLRLLSEVPKEPR